MSMSLIQQIVIVGAGQAAVQAIDTFRRRGFKGRVILIGDEPMLPYHRPPLSKQFLAGDLTQERLALRPLQFYTDRAVTTHLGRRAVEISRTEQRVRLNDGEFVPYDALLLATGSRPRRLSVPGAELAGVHLLRNLADVMQLRAEFKTGKRLVMIGGGYIGLEVAATARKCGLNVTLLEMADRLMSRVTCSEISAFYEREHRKHGVQIICHSTVRALVGGPDGRVRAVRLDSGVEYPADLVLAGVGALPACELAVDAGIECTNGISVDEHCRTSDPHIFAAGDCTHHPSPHYGRRLRLESVDNAFEQGTSAALNLLGISAVHHKVPWV
jgi:3-phenylpropionate/trans-cinnamate dioxygenase ferredoxin reductase component